MKLELILAAALSAAPAAPQAPAPQRIKIAQGTVMTCDAPGGCYVATGRGIDELVREIAEQVRAMQCRKDSSI